MAQKQLTLTEFILSRTYIITKLDRFEEYLNQFSTSVNLIQLKLRLNKLEEVWRDFENVQSKIEILPESNQIEQGTIRQQFENSYFTLSARAEELIVEHNTETQSANGSVGQASMPLIPMATQTHVKLPVIELPKFNGNYQQWTQFRDTFKSLIHNSSILSEIEKFHYLKSSLQGDAANIIESLSITLENYEVAWNLITKRYENKRVIVHNHVNALLELPAITRESAIALRQLSDSFLKHIRALEALKQPVNTWDGIIIPLLCSKIDNNTKREWETAQDSTEVPKLEELITFLQKRCQILEASSPKGEIKNTFNINKPNKLASHLSTYNKTSCALCNGEHNIYSCAKFLKLNNKERFKQIKTLKLCINCLRGNHFSKDCNASSCKTCGLRHNTLLHSEQPRNEAEVKVADKSPGSTTTTASCTIPNKYQVLLSTAIVNIFDANGNKHECRALLDSGSQSHFITEDLCTKLNLSCHKLSQNFPISGIGQSTTNIRNCTEVKIKSRHNGFQTVIKCLVLPTITDKMPTMRIDSSNLKIPSNLRLADYTYNTPGSIDLLIGADLFYHLLCVGQIQLRKNQPILQKTKLGWLISGTIHLEDKNMHKTLCFLNTNKNLENQLAKFWSIEEVDNQVHYSKTELKCEQHYAENTTREHDGRYVVKLPIKEDIEVLGDSYQNTLKRFMSLEKRLQQNENLKSEYIQFMREFETLRHMSPIASEDESNNSKTYYLPHHAVVKHSSITTKVRVVFDGSAKTSTDISLNDVLLVGPTIQDGLFDILIRFRSYQFVLTADIEKMYRQVNIHPENRNLQRIIWRENPSLPLKTYTLNTVTYGTSSAPFLAIRTLKQLAADEGHLYPDAAKVLLTNFYVDDCLTGSSTIEKAKQLKQELTQLLSKGRFNLCKWRSNEKTILEEQETQDDNLPLSLDDDQPIKTLGLYWNPSQDTLQYTYLNKEPRRVNKRGILSIISQIFDPLGLLGPIITLSKLFMQQLWQLKLDWDETLPTSLHTKWQNYFKDLNTSNVIKVPRKLITPNQVGNIQIHGFSDASEATYGACLYLKSIASNGDTQVSLICSKSRVAPLKSLSIPRLELCAALLLSKLSQRVCTAISLDIEHIYHWTDSSIVLAWIKTSPHLLKQFIANRIAEIQDLTQAIHWKHVPSHDNPADLLSRGVLPSQLVEKDIWWSGPSWLKEDESHWPKLNLPSDFTMEEFESKRIISLIALKPDFTILEKYSSFMKLKRIIAVCLRFKWNAINKNNKQQGSLTITELQQAEISIIKLLQQQHFDAELKTLKKSNIVDKRSKLLNLSPFLDNDGLIRVGGRLKNAFIPYGQKYPIILPAKGNITESIIREEHLAHYHCGPQSLLAFLRLKYWPLAAKNIIKKITRNCITCFRCNPIPSSHIMGHLPEARTSQGKRPFSISGVDYCGPFSLIESKGRGRKRVLKCYVAIFICFSTKAIHVEPVTELTGEAFLSVLKRFTARKGLCVELYSDNGTNFTKSNNDLQEMYEFLKQQKNMIAGELAQQNINWHFNPPRSPHFGGLWESAVKLFKYHLKRVLNLNLTYEEFNTITTQIEAIINSRPLIPLSSDPSDLTALIPAHFLIGDSLVAPLEVDITVDKEHLLSRWQHLQRIRQHFWKRWSRDYLHNLQSKAKWAYPGQNLEIGALVLLIDDNTPPQQWKTGRISQLHPGNDRVVRVVSVKTNAGIFKRSVRKICVLFDKNL